MRVHFLPAGFLSLKKYSENSDNSEKGAVPGSDEFADNTHYTNSETGLVKAF